ncbi:MAG: hypothetical protein PHU23_05205 [Dehalococcoidales bacterium]|nr:hypothetical protein [Dehalococcoidales bacterium]
MIEIPPEVVIKSTIKTGSVYYFPEETIHSAEPHYFIVLNINPTDDTILILVCASSRVEKVKLRRRMCPPSTLVEVTPTEYEDFTVPSIIDCNYVLEKSITQLIEKLSTNKLRLKSEMDMSIVDRIRNGVKDSILIDRRIKQTLFGN